MLQIGITGGMGTGKSTVCKIFEMLAVPILNTDALAKNIIATNKIVQEKLQEKFGIDIFINNILNKKLLAARAFDTVENTSILNNIVHPYVFEAIEIWQKKIFHKKYCVRESALLIESKSYKNCDIVIGITCPLNIRLDRIIKRDQCTKDEALLRIQKQMPEEEKMKFYDYTILNDAFHFLIPQVLEIHKNILVKSESLK